MPHTDLIVKGVKWPSVTEIVGILDKPFLAIWRGKIGNEEANRIMNESAATGRNLHEMVEKFLNCNSDESFIDTPRFKAWYDWYCTSGYICEDSELKVISKKHKYGGTFDALLVQGDARQPSNLVLTDWKFSNSDDHFRWLQLAGYAQAYYEETGVKIQKGMIVRVDKDAKVHVKTVENLWKYVPLFINLRKMFDFVKKKGRWK